jgi:HTH-type transcriptional regulator / antitoxin HigA
MSHTRTRMTFAELPADYQSLVNEVYLPRTIHDDVEYGNVREVLDVLTVNAERLNRDQQDFLDTLATLVEEYDRAQGPLCKSRLGGLNALKYLLKENKMSGSDLGRLLGHRTLGSAILRGQRPLTVAHILKLAERFKVDPSLFLDKKRSQSLSSRRIARG